MDWPAQPIRVHTHEKLNRIVDSLLVLHHEEKLAAH